MPCKPKFRRVTRPTKGKDQKGGAQDPKWAALRDANQTFSEAQAKAVQAAENSGSFAEVDATSASVLASARALKAARQATEGRIIAVHQPHRYTRLHHHFEEFCSCFNEADVVAIAEVYAAGEEPIEGADRDGLVAGLIAHGHRHACGIDDLDGLVQLLREQAQSGDMVVCLGAGTISAWAHELPGRLG